VALRRSFDVISPTYERTTAVAASSILLAHSTALAASFWATDAAWYCEAGLSRRRR